MDNKLIKKIKNKLSELGSKKHQMKWLAIFSFVLMLILTNPTIVSAVDYWWETDEKALTFLTTYKDGLNFTKGGIMSVALQSMSWSIIRGAYFICSGIENLIREDVLTLFKFVESTKIGAVYESVLNTIVVGLMIISLIIIGYKMVLGKGNLDLKSVGMNIVMSVSLILLMPTMINSGIEFAKIFYNDATTINRSDGGVAWTLIENDVTDLVYINDKDVYNRLSSQETKNALKKEDFYSYDFSEIITVDTAGELEKDNPKAKYLKYRLTPDGDGNMRAVKIDDGFMSLFSDSFKGGYYRYNKNTFSLIVSLLALAVAYVFSAFVIISAILELAFKRVLSVLVFATDLETGQRSKMVLTDILQCYLIVGFQGFGLSMFALTIEYLNSTDINVLIKTIAYVSAVFILLKGSSTIMRYFGVDIGLKEGYGQLASTLALGAGLARKASSVSKGTGGKSENPETEERKPEKNFGESLSKKAQKIGSGAGYAKERGLSGLASDGASAVGNQLARPFKAVHDVTEGASKGLKEGYNQGTAEAISKNMKSSNGQNNQRKEASSEASSNINQQKNQNTDSGTGSKVMSSSERMRMSEQMNQSRNPQLSEVQERVNATSSQSRNPQVSEVQERVNATSSQSRNPQVSEVQERVNATSSQSRNPQVSEVQERVNSAGSSARSTQTVDVQERVNSAGSSARGAQTVDVQERVNSAGSSARGTQTVDVQTNISSTGSKNESVLVEKEVKEKNSFRSRFTIDDNPLFQEPKKDNPLFDFNK